MADRTQLKAADHNDIADDDPFAELTRIMGFDPRQPVKPQAPAEQNVAPADQLADEGDFDIDLEKELMGEFGTDADDVIAAAEVREPVAEVREPAFENADAMDDALAASLEQDFLLDDDAADQAVHGFAVAPEAPAPAVEAAFDDDFDNAVASSLEDVSPFEDDLPVDDELAASLEQGFLLDDDATDDNQHSIAAAEVAAPVTEAAVDDGFDHDDFDNAVSMSLEDELTLDSHSPDDDYHAGSAAEGLAAVEVADYPAAPVEAAAYAGEAVSDQDFVGHFDDAMADVDMDFEVRADQPTATDAPLTDETPVEPVYAEDNSFDVAPQQAYDVAAQEAQEAFDDFDLTFDDALADEIEAPVAQVATVPAEPIVAPVVERAAAPVVAADERTLEDELNALLGTMKARTASVVEEPAMVQQPVTPVQRTDGQPTDPVVELDWDLDEHEAGQPLHAEMGQAADADLDNLLQDELEGHDYEADAAAPATPAAAADIHFDDDAFDAAFARSIDLGAGAAALSARSTPPEPARSWSRMTPVAQSQPSFAAQPMASLPPVASVPSYRQEPVEKIPAYAEPAPAQPEQSPRYDEMPDVETVDVPERVVALADDLDIPELNFDEDEPAAAAYDDLDAEFSSLLTDMNATEVAAAPQRNAAYDDDSYSAGFKPGYERNDQRAYAARPAEVPANAATSYADAANGFDIDDLPGIQPASQADDFAVDELDYDPELDEAMAVPGLAGQEAPRQPRRSGLLIAALVGAVAIAGGVGAFTLSFGGKGGSDAPVIVKADNTPIKVKPENPGGAVVPNQDNKVYDAVVKGTKPAEPVQEKLVTNTEEPVDVTAKEPQSRVVDLSPDDTDAAADTDAAGNTDAAAPAPKSEDRIAQVLQEADQGTNSDVVAIAPRKVRTMVVKPDGSLVAREDPAAANPQVAATEPVDPAPQHVAPAGQADAEQTGTVPAAADQASEDQAETVKPVKPAAEPKAEAKAQSANTPASVPLAPQRPSDQPVDVVGEVKPDQVASIPTTASTGGGSWSMQIASQPTVESAQANYADLQRRYDSVLAGRTANIVKAEIAGKGTFYRVRVPAQSRNDAINLCTSYKAAGGNCFVSR